jgi:TolA-binding protein
MRLASSFPGGILGLALLLGGCTESAKDPVVPERHAPERHVPATNVMMCAPGSFMDGNECIPVKAPECPTGTALQEGQCVPSTAVATPEPKVAVAAQPEGFSSEYDDLLDPRPGHRTPRARVLMITEVQGLEALFQSVPKSAGERPAVMRRLAEDYVELAAASAHDLTVAPNAEAADKARKIELAAHITAAKYYKMLVDQYPVFCQNSSAAAKSGCADEPLYYLGLEYLRLGQPDNARKAFLSLIKDWPGSDKVPPAYFLFGEMFRSEAAADPTKWVIAEQAFAKTAEFVGPFQTPALLRLAEAYEKQGKTAEAAATRKKAAKGKPPASVAAPGGGP